MPKGKKKERVMPKNGAKFKRTFNGKNYILKVVYQEGVIKYKLGGELYDSPSAAAQSLVKNKYAVNGWVFWGMKNY